jgi:hypothetical protein
MIGRRIFTGRLWFRNVAMVTFGLAMLLATAQVYGHGGKTHGSSFTALQALQKATELYDKLVVSGKLSDSWETDLRKVNISNRQKGDQREYVVSFERSAGEPNTVYIFFTAEGKYSGSNFTGE